MYVCVCIYVYIRIFIHTHTYSVIWVVTCHSSLARECWPNVSKDPKSLKRALYSLIRGLQSP